MNVLCVQPDIVWKDKSANYDTVRRLLDAEKIESGTLVVLPEMFSTGFSMDVAAIRETEADETRSFLSDIATSYQTYVLGGLVTQGPGGLGRNQAVLVDPEGHEQTRYTKLHPFSYAGETKFYAPGEKIVTVPIHGFTLAPFICYDLRFPEIFRQAVVRGAEVMTVIACWPQAREAHWVALLKARAIENQAYVVAVNRVGSDPPRKEKPAIPYGGRSMIIDPQGEILEDAGNREGGISAHLDRQFLLDYRQNFPALNDIRPEYKKV